MIDIEIIRDKNSRSIKETISVNPNFIEVVENEEDTYPLSILYVAGRRYMCPVSRETLVKILDSKD